MSAVRHISTVRAVVAGSINQDLVVRTERLPAEGETAKARSVRTSPGGKGANQAVALARLGAEVTFFGAVGDDAAGRELRTAMTTDGVDTSNVQVAPGPTGTAIVHVDDAGRNTIVVAPGANGRVGPDIGAGSAVPTSMSTWCCSRWSFPPRPSPPRSGRYGRTHEGSSSIRRLRTSSTRTCCAAATL